MANFPTSAHTRLLAAVSARIEAIAYGTGALNPKSPRKMLRFDWRLRLPPDIGDAFIEQAAAQFAECVRHTLLAQERDWGLLYDTILWCLGDCKIEGEYVAIEVYIAK